MDNYLAYSTEKKVIGLIKLPLEGNPNHTMGYPKLYLLLIFVKVWLLILEKLVILLLLLMENYW